MSQSTTTLTAMEDSPTKTLSVPSAEHEAASIRTATASKEHLPKEELATGGIRGSDHVLAKLSPVRKGILLFVFSIATFIDICNVSGVGVATAQIAGDTGLKVSQIVWIITAYSLAFASFLLFAGRLSDLFPAQIVFVSGFTGLGIISLVTSFVTTNKYGFLVLRGLGGVAGAMTIPSAYNLIVNMYPDPVEKQKRLALLGLAGALGNVLGLVLSGLTMLASYHWFFRLITIICFVFSAITCMILPFTRSGYVSDGVSRWRRLDIVGVGIMAICLVFLNLGLTQGPIDGWSSGIFIGPFVASLVLGPCFFLWENWVHPNNAVLPSTVWKIKNIKIASVVNLVPFSFWVTNQLLYAVYWQRVRGWTALHVAAAVLPQGIAALVVGGLTQVSPIVMEKPRWTVPISAVMMMISEVLMYYSDGGWGTDYWRYCFPAFVIGSMGAIAMFMASGVNVITYCPPEMGGVAGAWTQVIAQVGGAITLAVQAGMSSGTLEWRKDARSFWFEFAAFALVAIAAIVFYKKPIGVLEEHEIARENMRNEIERRDAKTQQRKATIAPV